MHVSVCRDGWYSEPPLFLCPVLARGLDEWCPVNATNPVLNEALWEGRSDHDWVLQSRFPPGPRCILPLTLSTLLLLLGCGLSLLLCVGAARVAASGLRGTQLVGGALPVGATHVRGQSAGRHAGGGGGGAQSEGGDPVHAHVRPEGAGGP